jgi:hypothetical protein
MSDSGAASSSASSTKLNSSTLSNKKRTLSDAGLDDTAEVDSQNNGKRVVVFEAFKLFDVQSAVRYFILFLKSYFTDVVVFFFRKNLMQNFYLFKIKNYLNVFKNVVKPKLNGRQK